MKHGTHLQDLAMGLVCDFGLMPGLVYNIFISLRMRIFPFFYCAVGAPLSQAVAAD